MATTACRHKSQLGCVLTATPVCCSCADIRPIADSYPVYIDGEGMTMSGSRWQKYCWKCRDHWTFQSRGTASAEGLDRPLSHTETSVTHPWVDQTPTWSFSRGVQGSVNSEGAARRHQRVLPTRDPRSISILPSAPPSIATSIPPATDQPRGASYEPSPATNSQRTNPRRHRRPPRNPFGTREEWESPDYQSPLAGMFTRAWTRYADAEDTRQREDDSIRGSLRSIRQQRSNGTALDGAVPDSIYEHGGLLTDELRRVRQLASDMASAVETIEGYQIVTEPEPTPTINPIDAQRRPPALSAEQMMISAACRICNEQKVDTLVEPCMHICMCHWCSEIIRQQAQEARRRRIPGRRLENLWRCPICRKDVLGVRRVYLT